jgi:hypothetical protein
VLKIRQDYNKPMTNEVTIKNFDAKYAGKGGVAKLVAMYENGESTADIGRVFGLENKQVNYYLKKILGEKYYRFSIRRAVSDLGLSPLAHPKDNA